MGILVIDKRRKDINAINLERQRTAHSNSAEVGNLEMVLELFKHGVDPNLPSNYVLQLPFNLAKSNGYGKSLRS